MLQLLKNLRSFSHGREITDAHILDWANKKVKSSGKSSQMDSFKVCTTLGSVTIHICNLLVAISIKSCLIYD